LQPYIDEVKMFDLEKKVEEPKDSESFLKDILSKRIQSTDVITSAEYLMKIDGVKKISKDNISGFIGLAKSRKSFAVTMFVSALVGGLNLYNKFQALKKCKVLAADTEQSADDVQLVTKRIKHLVGDEVNLFMYALKPFNPTERLNAIELLLIEHKPDVLVIDGIKDLIYNINDPVECTNVMSRLQKWNVEFDIHICCVLHQNKGDGNARGHIGTELNNKCQILIRVTQNENDKTISHFEEVFGRGKGIDGFDFFVNNEYKDFGIPEVVTTGFTEGDLTADPF